MFGIRALVLFGASSLIALAAPAQQQDVLNPKDTSALHPPPGAKVAIVEFADMECPMCAMDNLVIQQAVDKYHVAWERHDYPLPQHNWSFQAAVNARWAMSIATRSSPTRRASRQRAICRILRRSLRSSMGRLCLS